MKEDQITSLAEVILTINSAIRTLRESGVDTYMAQPVLLILDKAASACCDLLVDVQKGSDK